MNIEDKINIKERENPVTCGPQDMVIDPLKKMCNKQIGCVVVLNKDGSVAGLLTEREMLLGVLGKNLDPQKTSVSKIMRKNVRVARINDEVVDWLRTMTHERFRYLPVVDEHNKLISLFSQGDFVAYTWPDLHEKVRQTIKGKIGRSFQIILFIFALLTLGLIAFNF